MIRGLEEDSLELESIQSGLEPDKAALIKDIQLIEGNNRYLERQIQERTDRVTQIQGMLASHHGSPL